MKKITSTAVAVMTALLGFAAHAADTPAANAEAKDLKAQSEGQYKARKHVAEANEELNKADCKSSLEGSAKSACEKSAKARAKSDKADAKTVHEAEEQAIKAAKKP